MTEQERKAYDERIAGGEFAAEREAIAKALRAETISPGEIEVRLRAFRRSAEWEPAAGAGRGRS